MHFETATRRIEPAAAEPKWKKKTVRDSSIINSDGADDGDYAAVMSKAVSSAAHNLEHRSSAKCRRFWNFHRVLRTYATLQVSNRLPTSYAVPADSRFDRWCEAQVSAVCAKRRSTAIFIVTQLLPLMPTLWALSSPVASSTFPFRAKNSPLSADSSHYRPLLPSTHCLIFFWFLLVRLLFGCHWQYGVIVYKMQFTMLSAEPLTCAWCHYTVSQKTSRMFLAVTHESIVTLTVVTIVTAVLLL